MNAVSFRVPGKPQQRGSKKAVLIPKRGGGFLTRPNGSPMVIAKDANEKSKPWMALCALVASQAMATANQSLLDGPVNVVVEFTFLRPKSHFGSGKNARIVKGSSPTMPTSAADLDKLCRCLLDSLTGIVFRDDSQVCRIVAEKVYGDSESTDVCVRRIVRPGENSNEQH